jgi:hypothetical protein
MADPGAESSANKPELSNKGSLHETEGGSLPLSHPAATFPVHPSGDQAVVPWRGQMPILRVCVRRSSLSRFGEQAEQGNHNLNLQVPLSLEVDAFLDGSEADFTLHQFIDDVNYLSQATPRTIARSQSAGLRALSMPSIPR